MEKYYHVAAGIFLVLVLTLLVMMLWGLSRALHRAGRAGSRLPAGLGLGLLAWLVFLALLAQSGFFMNFSLPPRFALAVLPPLLLTLYLAGSGKINFLLGHVPAGWLVGPQVFRVAVEFVLWLLFLDNLVPVQMTFEGLNFDILVGLTAPFAALFMARHPGRKVAVGVVWNILGLGLLLNIVTIAVLSAPFPFRVFLNEPANTLVAQWPFIWLPGFVVPLAFLLHVFSLKQLLAGSGAQHTAGPENSVMI